MKYQNGNYLFRLQDILSQAEAGSSLTKTENSDEDPPMEIKNVGDIRGNTRVVTFCPEK